MRTFEVLLRLLAGSRFGSDALGQRSLGTLVVDTDGSYHGHDSLKATRHNLTRLNDTVWSADVKRLERHQLVLATTDKQSKLPASCRPCDIRTTCGGGLLAHR